MCSLKLQSAYECCLIDSGVDMFSIRAHFWKFGGMANQQVVDPKSETLVFVALLEERLEPSCVDSAWYKRSRAGGG